MNDTPSPLGGGAESHLYTEQRPWGEFTVLLDAPDCKVKRITVKAGHQLSLQRHKYRQENWQCISGNGIITLGFDQQHLKMFSFVPVMNTCIPMGYLHRVCAGENQDLVFIEVQTGSYFGEDDIERFEDDYDRAN